MNQLTSGNITQKQIYDKGRKTFSLLFTRWMDSNEWSHPDLTQLSKLSLGGTGWLHSSQISNFRHVSICNPGPRPFIAIERLNFHLYQYTEHGKLIPGTTGSNLYVNAQPILEAGKPPELGWWFEVFCGLRIPNDERLMQKYVSGHDAETFSKNYGRLVRKLIHETGGDACDHLSFLIKKHYPAGDAHRISKLLEVVQSRAVWSPDELLLEIPAITVFISALGGPTDEQGLLALLDSDCAKAKPALAD